MGLLVGGALSLFYDVRWDEHELVVLALDTVLGWRVMEMAARASPYVFIVEGVRFSRSFGLRMW